MMPPSLGNKTTLDHQESDIENESKGGLCGIVILRLVLNF